MDLDEGCHAANSLFLVADEHTVFEPSYPPAYDLEIDSRFAYHFHSLRCLVSGRTPEGPRIFPGPSGEFLILSGVDAQVDDAGAWSVRLCGGDSASREKIVQGVARHPDFRVSVLGVPCSVIGGELGGDFGTVGGD